MKLIAPLIVFVIAGLAGLIGLSTHPNSQNKTAPNQMVQGAKQEYANVTHPILVSFEPKSQTVIRNKNFSVQLSLDANELSVTGIDLTLPLDSSLVDFVSFNDAKSLNTPLISNFNKISTNFRFSSVDTSTKKLSGKMIIGTLTLRAKAPGNLTIHPSRVQLTASGYDKAIPTQVETTTLTIK